MSEDNLSDLYKAIDKVGNIRVKANDIRKDIEVVPTGILSVDLAMGVGGFPRGRITEVYGPEMSGKTSLILCAIAEAQKQGKRGAIIDVEQAFDPFWAETLGVDLSEDKFTHIQPESAEQALDVQEMMIRSGLYDIIGLDSIAALVPMKELEGTMEENTIGLQARLLGKALRKQTPAINRTNTAVVMINQLRMKTGVMYGNPETTPGGRAMAFYATIRLDVRPTEKVKDGLEVTGAISKVKVVKNKVAPPLRIAMFTFDFDTGVDKLGSVIDVAINLGVIKKSGAWMKYGDQSWQGSDGAKKALKADPAILAKVTEDVHLALAKNPLVEIEND